MRCSRRISLRVRDYRFGFRESLDAQAVEIEGKAGPVMRDRFAAIKRDRNPIVFLGIFRGCCLRAVKSKLAVVAKPGIACLANSSGIGGIGSGQEDIMFKAFTFAALSAAGMLLGACQAEMLSNDRIISSTATVIGVRPDQFTIVDRLSDMTNTYYTAHTNAGVNYACVINGGGVLEAGMVDPPMCKQTAAR